MLGCHDIMRLSIGCRCGFPGRGANGCGSEPFPFPDGLSPDIPASDYANNPQAVAIAETVRRLVELRDCGLNPPDPKRPVA